MLRDVRYAFRMMCANPLFASTAVISLALGIGANTAIYSLMDAILVTTLPVRDPEALVALQWHSTERPPMVRRMEGSTWNTAEYGRISTNLPWRAFEFLSQNNKVLEPMAAFNDGQELIARIDGVSQPVPSLYVSGAFFGVVSTRPAAGRLIEMDDDRESATPVAVASYRFAQRRFGDVRNALGRTVTINEVLFTIVGVAAPGFHGIHPGQERELYLPLHSQIQVHRIYPIDPHAKWADAKHYWLEILGRRKAGVSVTQAQAELAPLFDQFTGSVADSEAERANLPKLIVKDASRGLDSLQRQYSKPLFFLMALVVLILTIACANLANLLLARATGRRREMALRLSLGAGRGRLVRQLLTESVLLAALGAALGVLFAQWGLRGLLALIANGQQTFLLEAGLNWRVLSLTAGLALVAGVLFGLAPALQSTKVDLITTLKQTRARRMGGRQAVGRMLVVGQMAMSLLLLVSAGLFLRTLAKLNSVDLGFNREHVLTFTVDARQAGYRDQAIARFFDNLHVKLAAIPGVRRATASQFPLVAQKMNSSTIRIPGYNGIEPDSAFLHIAPNFFETLEIRVLLGRPIDARDVTAGAKVAVVNEVFAQKYFDGPNVVGRHFYRGNAGAETEFEIVGVARNARYHSLKDELPPVAYVPYTHNPYSMGHLTFQLRATGDPMLLANAAREAVRQADSRAPVTEVRTQDEIIDQTIGQERAFAALCTVFALLAVVIASVGLYGTMAYSVARRTNEIGVRMALGAERWRVIRMVLGEVGLLASAGVAIGLPVALAATRFVRSFLFEIQANDVWTLAGAMAVLGLAALAAGYVPARRASRVDPWIALRNE
jgi:macrolide transport system ATP-binding/permease protein